MSVVFVYVVAVESAEEFSTSTIKVLVSALLSGITNLCDTSSASTVILVVTNVPS